MTMTRRNHEILEQLAVIALAGAAGADLAIGRDFDWTGADCDRHNAIDNLSRVEFEADALGAFASLCQYRARNLIRYHHKHVKAVAEALLQRSRLTFQEVKQIIYPPLTLSSAAATGVDKSSLVKFVAGRQSLRLDRADVLAPRMRPRV